MRTKRKNRVKNGPPVESKPVVKKAKLLNTCDSEASAKQQVTRGSVHLFPHLRSSSASPSIALSLAHQSSSTISAPLYTSSTVTSGAQAVIENQGNNNWSHVGDDNGSNIGIIGHNSINFLVQQFYHRTQAGEQSASIKLRSITAIIYIEATQQVLNVLFGNMIANSAEQFETVSSKGNIVEQNLRLLIESIKSAIERDDRGVRQALRNYLKDLLSDLCQVGEQVSDGNVEIPSLDIAWKSRLFLFASHMGGYIPPRIIVEGVKKRMTKLLRDVEAAGPRRMAKDLPRARTAYDEYVSSHQRRVSCFEGTRQALLEEMGGWVSKAETGIFVLFGLAGIGKSTIAQTVAERADNVRLLGASFFFSRDDAERRTAEKFFTTIASQLRVHDPEFASAIENTLMTEQGKEAVSKFPLEQLEMLILEPLQSLVSRKVVIVIDALDECDAEDIPTVLMGLNKLVQVLPLFKVVLTTRPQQHLQILRTGQAQKVFDLHDIEDKIVDDDIERYLRHKLSLEEVKACLPNLREPWAASDDEIKFLVRAAGRLFVIASTAVLFILDKTSTPADRMKLLLSALERDHIPLKALNSFYTTILRSAVPESCEDDTRNHYQTIIGTIILIQQPLTVSALAKLINVGVNRIAAVLGNLQSVILLGSDDIPLTYHKSFPDYIQDSVRCKYEDLRIDPMSHHTRMATHCLRLLNQHLKQNILDLSGPAQFMENSKALEKQGLTEHQLLEKIPTELQYACLYFTNHIGSADVENPELVEELTQFFNNRILNWLEALSWIGKLDSASRALLTVQKQLKPTSSDLNQLVTDGLRFVWKFYQLIDQSSLHIYHSALPVTPTKTRLYERYGKQMSICQVQGGQETWDEVIATFELAQPSSYNPVNHVVFSSNGTLFACSMNEEDGRSGLITIHSAVAGIPLGKIKGQVFAIANDFSKAAAFDDGSITLYDVKGPTPIATIRPSATVVKLAFSPDGSRLVAGLDDASVCIWDEKCEQIESFRRWEKCKYGIAFSSDGSRTAFTSCDGIVKLLDGASGRTVADLEFPGLEQSTLLFSGDGSRLVCLSMGSLRIWDSQDGTLIGTAEDVGDAMAISTDGSRLVTGAEMNLKLFSGNNLALLETLDAEYAIRSLAIHGNLIGAAFRANDRIALYDINNHAWIAQLPFAVPHSLAFSPDCTRLVAGNLIGGMRLWDVSSITASNVVSQEKTSTPFMLAFSPDCSRLASGYGDGTIRLWDTTNMTEITASPHIPHSCRITALSFSVDGEEFASGSEDGVVKLWTGKDGAPRSVLECSGRVRAVAFSSSVLAASTSVNITLWDLKSRSVIATLDQKDAFHLTFCHHHSLLAVAHNSKLTLWDTAKQESITTFKLTYHARRMTFLPGDSLLAVQDGIHHNFFLFNTHDNEEWESEVSANQDISRRSLCTSWHGISVWNSYRDKVVGRFPQQEDDVTVFNGNDFHVSARAEGSSMIALGCWDGCILLIKAA